MLGPRTERDEEPTGGCPFRPPFAADRLVLEADDCPGEGRLAEATVCRATAVRALRERDAAAVLSRHRGRERAYKGCAAALLTAAGRFADAVGFRDEQLAELAARHPLRAAREATGRSGPVARLAAETGLAEAAERGPYEEVLRPAVGPTVARSRATGTRRSTSSTSSSAAATTGSRS